MHLGLGVVGKRLANVSGVKFGARDVVKIKANPVQPSRVESEPMSLQALKALERRVA
jgi:hypothetical protein